MIRKRGRPRKYPVSTTLCAVYALTNPEGQKYVGVTHDLEERWYYHKTTYAPAEVRESMKIHGASNHTYEILKLLPSRTTKQKLKWYEEMFLRHFVTEGITVMNRNKTGGRGKPKRKVAQYSVEGALIRI